MKKHRNNISSLLLLVLATLVMTGLASGAEAKVKETKSAIAFVDPQDTIQLAEAKVVAKKEMEEMRAGFIDPSGFIFKFAVDVQAQIDGALMFVRSLVLQSHHDGAMQASASSHVIAENLPPDTKAEVLDNGTGVVVTNDSGKTTILNQASSGSFSNVIVNTADNRTISQTMNIDLVLQNVNSIIDKVSALKNLNAPAGLHQISRMHTIGFGL